MPGRPSTHLSALLPKLVVASQALVEPCSNQSQICPSLAASQILSRKNFETAFNRRTTKPYYSHHRQRRWPLRPGSVEDLETASLQDGNSWSIRLILLAQTRE